MSIRHKLEQLIRDSATIIKDAQVVQAAIERGELVNAEFLMPDESSRTLRHIQDDTIYTARVMIETCNQLIERLT